ncbi:glycine-rich protein isoform X2 [Wolffia australiana]
MAQWGRRNTDEAVDDFDDYDPTPYSGGYDIALTYGRPIPPSEETCYLPNAHSSSTADFDRPNFQGSARPSTFGYGSEERRSDYDSGYGRQPDLEEEQSYEFGYEERPKPKPYREEQRYDFEGRGDGDEEVRQEYGRPSSGEYGYGERPRYEYGQEEDYRRA